MRPSALRYYAALFYGLALASLVTLDWSAVWALSPRDWTGFAALAALAVVSESLAIPIVVGRHTGLTSITFLPLLACVLLFGPELTVLFTTVTAVLAQFLIHRREPFAAAFNLSQWVVSTRVAGLAFAMLGGIAITDAFDLAYLRGIAAPFAVFGFLSLVLNQLAVAGFVAAKEDTSFVGVFRKLSKSAGANLLYDLLVSPVAIGVAFLYLRFHVVGLVITLFPLLFVRYSYLTNFRLERANRDLLAMMVKAIETRDPYTSGHSRRVAVMARRIAEVMRLPGRVAESVETAALLHDIGKIEADCAGIIRKPGQLSAEERRQIQAHATKGAELIRSLSSFKKDVVVAVEHHHERYDGRGYPLGLSGESIPLGARIIMISDAVDAMLSDRPYRPALSVPEVREELERRKGTQFDPSIATRVLRSNLLEKQYREVLADGARSAEARGREAPAPPAGREFSVGEDVTHSR